ncbi:pyridoxamine 5'-phosphate oxidase [Thiohalorhabdus sp.]|uniref:pyridoxamine 5'-phosphate oxidase n=1 Tax=Thiohalorhabdus sp. TaxID=3094134 RepID=UPI002FC2E944
MTQPQTDPLTRFHEWLREAEAHESVNPNAMSLATANSDGLPSVRMVLLKEADEQGFVFYTNLESRKAQELETNPRAALCFYWKSLGRQVRVEGPVEPVSEVEADAYFASRPRGSQIGAWASHQSQPLASRSELKREAARYSVRFGVGAIPRPPYWSGYRVFPQWIEFWEERAFRLHDRIAYHRQEGGGWEAERLYP